MTFQNQMFNPQYVNPQYYYTVKDEITSDNDEQCQEVANAVKAIHDLCEAVKKLDSQHQQTAFYACLAEMAKEFGWNC
jgi:hypothetical protein